MGNKAFRGNRGRKGVNSIFLVGEVVDMGVMPHSRGINVRARLKIRCETKKSSFVYIDVYGKRSCSDVMSLICQTGNIVYVEGEFRNSSLDRINVMPYVLVTHIECLLRRRDLTPPSTKIIKVLDNLDPIGYVPNTTPKKRKKLKEQSENEKKYIELSN